MIPLFEEDDTFHFTNGAIIGIFICLVSVILICAGALIVFKPKIFSAEWIVYTFVSILCCILLALFVSDFLKTKREERELNPQKSKEKTK